MTENFMTTQEVAERLKLNVQKIRKLIRSDNLPGIWMGKSYRIPESELIRWMETRRIRRQP